MQITLKDIARMADVAESTVSRALNNKPGVGEDTKLKIIKIAKKHNYRPNQLARGLAANKTNMIAVILSEMDSPGNIEIVKSLEKAAEKNGYQIILCNTNNQTEKEKSYLTLLESNQVDGAIFIGESWLRVIFCELVLVRTTILYWLTDSQRKIFLHQF